MDDPRAQLSSASTSLDELIDRLVGIADEHRGDETEHVAADLDEVERALRSAARKLDHLVRRLGR
jgi:hypothetical protein